MATYESTEPISESEASESTENTPGETSPLCKELNNINNEIATVLQNMVCASEHSKKAINLVLCKSIS